MGEDFLSLYEEYLTDEAFKQYSKEDDKLDNEEDSSKSIRLDFSDEYIISITRFLREYLGFDVYEKQKKDSKEETIEETKEEIIEETKEEYVLGNKTLDLYHSGLKDLKIPYVKGISHEYANQHPEYVLGGYIVLVVDTKGKKATYLNPILIKEYINRAKVFDEYQEICEKAETAKDEIDAIHSSYLCIKAKVDRINQMHMILYETHTLRYVNSIKEMEKNKNEEAGKKIW